MSIDVHALLCDIYFMTKTTKNAQIPNKSRFLVECDHVNVHTLLTYKGIVNMSSALTQVFYKVSNKSSRSVLSRESEGISSI